MEKFAIEYSKKSDLHGQTLDFTPPNSEYHSFLYSSFLRTTTLKEIKEVFHPLTVFGYSNSTVHYSGDGKNIIQAVDDRETSINYSFKEDGIDKGALNFKKNRKSKLPMNVYAVVGGNGSGKSYKINQIISEHMAGDKKFSQILHFSLSPFDNIINFDKDGSRKEISDKGKDSDGEIIYEKVGFVSVKYPPILEVLKKAEALALTDVKKYLYQKSSKYLVAENTLKEGFEGKISIKESFSYYIQNLLIDLIASEDKLKMWGDCLNFFTFESWVDDIINAFKIEIFLRMILKKIDTLSSGQATILFIYYEAYFKY